MADYIDAEPEVQDLYNELAEKHGLNYLTNYNTKLLFNMKERKSKGKITLGSAEKCSAKDKCIHGFDFVIILDYAFWNTYPEKRNPLLYHEMLHCGVNDKYEPCIIPHDIEEFGDVVKEYGAWKSDVRSFRSQFELFENNMDINV